MASDSLAGHSGEIMAAQPVDTTTAAPALALFRDTMSSEPESLAGTNKDTQHMDIASPNDSIDSMGLSGDSPVKELHYKVTATSSLHLTRSLQHTTQTCRNAQDRTALRRRRPSLVLPPQLLGLRPSQVSSGVK